MVALPTTSEALDDTTCCRSETALFAGQDLEVGMVYVERVGETLKVTFDVNVDGWYLLETHVAISTVDPTSTNKAGIPQTKSWNPILGNSHWVTASWSPTTKRMMWSKSPWLTLE